jgi:hypothetical protein
MGAFGLISTGWNDIDGFVDCNDYCHGWHYVGGFLFWTPLITGLLLVFVLAAAAVIAVRSRSRQRRSRYEA